MCRKPNNWLGIDAEVKNTFGYSILWRMREGTGEAPDRSTSVFAYTGLSGVCINSLVSEMAQAAWTDHADAAEVNAAAACLDQVTHVAATNVTMLDGSISPLGMALRELLNVGALKGFAVPSTGTDFRVVSAKPVFVSMGAGCHVDVALVRKQQKLSSDWTKF